jgi:hypothetical protein
VKIPTNENVEYCATDVDLLKNSEEGGGYKKNPEISGNQARYSSFFKRLNMAF